MEDLKKLDDEIVKAAEALAATWPDDTALRSEGKALFHAVFAKRSASRPKLLSAVGAYHIWCETRKGAVECMQAVLDADRASIIKVIEACQRYDGNGGAKLGESVIIPFSKGRYVDLSDIRSALSTREG